MTTISVPLSPDYMKILNNLMSLGYGSNKADIMRNALKKAEEDVIISQILAAEKDIEEGRVFSGDLNEILKTFPS